MGLGTKRSDHTYTWIQNVSQVEENINSFNFGPFTAKQMEQIEVCLSEFQHKTNIEQSEPPNTVSSPFVPFACATREMFRDGQRLRRSLLRWFTRSCANYEKASPARDRRRSRG